MKAQAVRLYIRVRRSDRVRVFADPVFAGNNRLRPHSAMLEGKPQHCPGGVFYVRFTRDGKRVWENVGSDPQLAQLAQQRKQHIVDASAMGIAVFEAETKQRTPLAEAIATYLEDTRFTKAARTAAAYGETMRGFARSTAKKFLEDLDRRDVLRYMACLREKGNTARTVSNRLIFLRTFFRAYRLALPLNKGDWPSYTEKVVSCYRGDELKALPAGASRDESEMIQFFLCTGGRKREVQFAAWSDIDWIGKTLTITEKLDLGFSPKDREEGAIPLPDFLVLVLAERRARYSHTRLIFELKGGRTDSSAARHSCRLHPHGWVACPRFEPSSRARSARA